MSDKHQDSEQRPDQQQDKDKANVPNPEEQAPKKEMPGKPEGGGAAEQA